VELTMRQHEAIEDGRKAFGEVLRTRYPEDYPRLWAVAIASAFVQMLAASYGKGELIAAVNSGLAEAGLEVVRKRWH
jgi:hypothetical protein